MQEVKAISISSVFLIDIAKIVHISQKKARVVGKSCSFEQKNVVLDFDLQYYPEKGANSL